MDIPEIAVRSRQGMSKSLERMASMSRLDAVLSTAAPPPRTDLSDRREAILSMRTGHFFAGVDNPGTEDLIARKLHKETLQILVAADAACDGKFKILGHGWLSFGDPVDWHFDPISRRRAVPLHWTKIEPLNADLTGDSKVIWELNRHQWLASLGQAHRFTGDQRYAETFANRIREWKLANRRGIGINWTSSLEVAYRLIAWCWALRLFRNSPALPPQLLVDVTAGIREHALHVERYLSHYFSPNTHLTGEALGLFYAGVLFPELPGASRWRDRGARILINQLQKQVLTDGVYFEQSTYYQAYSTDIYLHFLILAKENGITLPAFVGERVQAMLDFLVDVSYPNGSLPQIGDSDGGRLLPLMHRTADDFHGTFAVAAAFFNRPDFAWAAGGPALEIAWLLGAAGWEAFAQLVPTPPSRAASRCYEHGGYAIMRSDWDTQAHHLVFDAGPLGCPVSGAHGHADLLSIQCAAFGESHIVDPGTGCYTADPAWRDYFRGSAAHSTVTVDRLNQATPAGPFSWSERPSPKLRRWISTDAFDLADAEHEAYRSLSDPVTHRRRVYFRKPNYWLVVDDLGGTATHGVELAFQFTPRGLTLGEDGWVRSPGTGGCGLLLRCFAPCELDMRLCSGETQPPRGWISPDYGSHVPSPAVVCSATAQLPLRVVTLLLPVEAIDAAPPEISVCRDGEALLLIFEREVETVRIDEQEIVIEPGSNSRAYHDNVV
jgi:hypothetical protein